MKRTLVIIGAGGHGRVCAELAERLGCWDSICFLDGKWPELSSTGHWDVVGLESSVSEFDHKITDFLVTIGSNLIREEFIAKLKTSNMNIVSLIAPEALVSPDAYIGEGCVVLPFAVIAVGASLGTGCIINHAATIDHDCQVGRCVHIAPGANISGDTQVGDRTWIGTGASLKQCLSVGADVTIGLGAAVVSDVANKQTVVGVPAKPIPDSASSQKQ